MCKPKTILSLNSSVLILEKPERNMYVCVCVCVVLFEVAMWNCHWKR
jgi:hypothetical protein